MFERVQAYTECMIDRQRMQYGSTLNSAKCEKNKFGEEKQDTLSQQLLNRNSSQAVRIRLGTSPSKNTKGKTKEKYHAQLPARRPASSVSKASRWQRKAGAEGRSVRPRRWETSRKTIVKGRSARPRGRDRLRKRSRSQPWARKRGAKNSAVVHIMWRQKGNGAKGSQNTMFYRTHGKNDVKASVYNAWQISPICRMLVAGAFVLDGTKPFYDKNHGRIV